MAKVARDAQSLLDALQSNVDTLRSGFDAEAPTDNLAKGLRDIETCCERLNNMLEDALVGVRHNGLTAQRTSVSIASLVAASMKQVRTSAEAKLVSFSVAQGPDVAARLDRTLLTRALAKLMGRIIAESEAGSEIAVSYRLERGDVCINLESNGSIARAGRTSLRPREDEADLEFCHLVAECHGGTLTIGAGAAPVYRLVLPCVV
jgi:K+-sensing histidine kinase KdpD